MGRTNIYAPMRKVFVVPNRFVDTWFYGFGTKIDAAESTLLGQTSLASNATPAKPVLYGVNFPKPAIYSKKVTGYSVRSFGDAGATIVVPYRKIRESRIKAIATTASRSKYVSVPFNGAGYAWMMNLQTYEAIGADKTALGIVDCLPTLAALRRYIWGANKGSKPQRASKDDITLNRVLETFVSDTLTTMPNGWTLVSRGGGMSAEG